jgi:hypothetical protein
MIYSKSQSKTVRPKKSEARLIAEAKAKAMDHLIANGLEEPWISQKMIDDVIRQKKQQVQLAKKQ